MHGNILADFERLYSANRSTRRMILYWKQYSFLLFWRSSFKGALTILDQQAEDLREMFRLNFPREPRDIYSTPGFDFPKLFNLLKAYPELAKENRKALEGLLYSMKATSFVSLRIDRIPEISEFIKDEESEGK